MRILLVGAGGVGYAFARIAARRDFFEVCVIADYDVARLAKGFAALNDRPVRRCPGRCQQAIRWRGSITEHGATHVMNAVDPVFDMPIFDGAFAAGADYLDMAMSLSKPHPSGRTRSAA